MQNFHFFIKEKLNYSMRSCFPYTAKVLQIAFISVTFLCLLGCISGCGNDNKNLEKARELSEAYGDLEIKYNDEASKAGAQGDKDKQRKAENLRDEVGNYKDEMDNDYIRKGKVSTAMLKDWEADLEVFKNGYTILSDPDGEDGDDKDQPDSDGDGVPDADDKCPNQHGERRDGCVKRDSDGDGVFDEDDKCPNKKGTRANKGCPKKESGPSDPPPPPEPIDTDGDGIYDIYDDCPREFGIERCKGCNDADKDGVCDKQDNCKDEKGVAPDGCPKITCNGENRSTFIEESALCSEVLKNCTLTLRPQKRVVLEEFKVPTSTGGGSLDYFLKDNLGRTLFSRTGANTSSEISKFFVDSPLQPDKTYQLILNPKGNLEIKTYCVSNFKNENIQFNYTSKPFIKQITFCQ